MKLPATFIQGVIFDLDGTLVDSGLDIEVIRREMALPPGQPILEALSTLSEARAAACREILARHEWEGAERATLMAGVPEFLSALASRHVRRAVLTRNSRETALATLERLGLEFEVVFGREDAPAKPDPSAIRRIGELWALAPRQLAIIGDYKFDLLAGRAADIWTVLYTAGCDVSKIDYADLADRLLPCFTESEELLAWISGE